MPVNDGLRIACEQLFTDQTLRPALQDLLQQPSAHIGNILAALVLEFHQLLHIEVDFSLVEQLPSGDISISYEFELIESAQVAENSAGDLVNLVVLGDRGQEPDFQKWLAAKRDHLLQAGTNTSPSVDTRCLLEAARSRDIPVRLSAANTMEFGQGARQRRIKQKLDDRIPCHVVDLARDKKATNELLAKNWLPVPPQYPIESARQALEAANKIGYPVVIKPRSLDNGIGVTVGVALPVEVQAAYDHATENGTLAVVEGMIPGFDHRLLVIDGQFIAATKRVAGHVIGDGRHSVAELVDAANRDPRRGPGHKTPLSYLTINPEATQMLAANGLTAASVPLRGQHISLRRAANVSQGGTSIDVTDIIHPDNCQVAIRAAEAMDLAVAGVDLICPDITRSWRETGGGICEVNFSPGLRVHAAPAEGQPRDVGGAMMKRLYADPALSRIPVAAVTGTVGKTTTCHMLKAILARHGLCVGLASTEGTFIGNDEMQRGDSTGPEPARRLLDNCRVEAAVLECARGGIIHFGVGFQECNVAAVTNVQNDYIGIDGIETIDDMARVKRLVVELARDMAVLNADDPQCRDMPAHVSAKRVCWVTMTGDDPLVSAHIAEGGPAVRLIDGDDSAMIALFTNDQRHDIVAAADVPATLNGATKHNTANAMFAAALAHGLGIPPATIRDGLIQE